MASEAQRLIGISLAKIAQSRVGRGGVSLHKNLLVATVLQKARYIFMEEAYHMVHGHYPQQCRQFVTQQQQHHHHIQQHHHHQQQQQQHCHGSNTIVGESQKSSMAPHEQQHYHHQPQEQQHHEAPKLVETNETELDHNDIYTGSSVIVKNERKIENDKENSPPEGLTYFDLDKHKLQRISELGQKRRRQISELETEEAVLSILPKRSKSDLLDDDLLALNNESESSLIAECIAPEVEEISHLNSSYSADCDSCETPMEIDRITSLVSIFSFGTLARSVSTPDLCSAQAKDSETMSQRTFLAMTV
ncbi:PH domain-containing protein DDB_G0275795-like [Bradysia coprophila]|uniref:PH domain-containing protein DDB_G0275795-like n=1 Tax=Bradysia coprophila TaxID=38358 RepID=UPI00187D8CC0|nr:PH domain-containing protein DDB_G0275795-like [Bradysia coprophila]